MSSFVLCREIRECLKLDPDHKDCFTHYKKVKKLVKQMDSVRTFINEMRWDECIGKAEAMLNTESDVFAFRLKAKSHLCHCHAKVSAGLFFIYRVLFGWIEKLTVFVKYEIVLNF